MRHILRDEYYRVSNATMQGTVFSHKVSVQSICFELGRKVLAINIILLSVTSFKHLWLFLPHGCLCKTVPLCAAWMEPGSSQFCKGSYSS